MNKRFKVSCFDPKSGSTRDLMLVASDEAAVMSLVQQAGLLAMSIELVDVSGKEGSSPPAESQPISAPIAVPQPSNPIPVAPVVAPVAKVVTPVAKVSKAVPVQPVPVAIPAPVAVPAPSAAPVSKAVPVQPAPVAVPVAVKGPTTAPVSKATSRTSLPAKAQAIPPASTLTLGAPGDFSPETAPVSRKRRRHNENTFPPEGEVVINVVPMLDMTFQLLFFFIITFQSPSGVEAQIPLTLPPPEGQQEASKDKKENTDKDIIPTIDSDVTVEIKSLNNPQYPGEMGEVEVSGLAKEVFRPTPGKSLDEGRAEVLGRLGDAMKQMAQDLKKDNLSLRLKADPGVKWERVIQVADTCRQAKFLGIRFEKPGGS